ncbi:MAG: enolase C-terminal domain-like protein [Ardenticatenales bacterium]
MDVTVRPYALPFRRPFVTGAATHSLRRGWLVRVRLPDGTNGTNGANELAGANGANGTAGPDGSAGRTGWTGWAGWGEAAPLEGHGGEDPADVPAALAAFGAVVTDPDAERLILGTPPGWAPLHTLSERLFPRAAERPCARAAFDLALADALARRDGLPLARWLSRAARPRVALNAVIDAVGPEQAGARAAAAVAAGFRTLKVKLTGDAAADERRLAAIREAVGAAVALRGDANGRWGVDEAITRLRGLVPFDLAYVEQPVAAADVAGLARVRRGVEVPIAADEALLYPNGPGIDAVLAAEAADIVILKPTLLGGPSAVWAAALAAARHGVGVTVTTSLDSAVGRHGALAVAAALEAATGACGLATGDLLAADVGPDIVIEDGAAVVNFARAGLGWDPSDAQGHEPA